MFSMFFLGNVFVFVGFESSWNATRFRAWLLNVLSIHMRL